MFKKFTIGLLTIGFVAILAHGVWAGPRYAGGSFFSCPPDTDLNGDGIPDCSYIAQFSWQGGTPGTSVAVSDLLVTQATLLCDNNGTAFKVTFGKGTRLSVTPDANNIGQTDGNGNFTTFSSFPNLVADFPSLADFREFWFGDTANHCRNKTQTEIALFITTVQIQGEVGTNCTDPNDIDTCNSTAQSPVLTCTTNNTFGDPPVVYSCQ
jgi:hypothetical protein